MSTRPHLTTARLPDHDGGWWAGGVKKAVDEFVRAYPVDVVTLEYEQFVLRKRQHGAIAL